MKTFLTGIAAAMMMTSSAGAATLTATSLDSRLSGFTIMFDDAGDGLLQFDEITAFSGIVDSPDTPANELFPVLRVVPNIAGISTASGPEAFSSSTSWVFERTDLGSGFPVNLIVSGAAGVVFTYEITGLATVPLPSSLPLILAGLAPFALVLRRRSKAAPS